MFIINPDPYSLPSYRIGPFTTKDISTNCKINGRNIIEQYFTERFKRKDYIYTLNGREAINSALSHYNLLKDDVVTIHTTTENFYISGCVTREIEKFCKWSRKMEPNTKIIFVNHEFGYPYNDLLKLKAIGLPIIEDCAQSFFSKDEDNITGTIGDFAIYSFPKMFPLQIGGLLVSNIDCKLAESKLLGKDEKNYVKNVLSYYINNKDEIIEKRLSNYQFLSQEFMKIGFVERFKHTDGIVPGVFMFKNNNLQLELPSLKSYLYAHGIQCSVFYGEESFFLPVHQALNEYDLKYFIEVIKSFILESKL